MPNFLQKISEIIANQHTANSGVVWYHLCAVYRSYLPTRSGLFFTYQHELLASLQQLGQMTDDLPHQLFIQTINAAYACRELHFTDLLLRMMKAFLTLYPDYQVGLHEQLLAKMQVQAYLIPDEANIVDLLLNRLDDHFVAGMVDVLAIKDLLSARQITLLLEFITKNLFSQHREIAHDALVKIYPHFSQDNIDLILTTLKSYLNYSLADTLAKEYCFAACVTLIKIGCYLPIEDIKLILNTLKNHLSNSFADDACLYLTIKFLEKFPAFSLEVIDFLLQLYQSNESHYSRVLIDILLAAYQKFPSRQDVIMQTMVTLYDGNELPYLESRTAYEFFIYMAGMKYLQAQNKDITAKQKNTLFNAIDFLFVNLFNDTFGAFRHGKLNRVLEETENHQAMVQHLDYAKIYLLLYEDLSSSEESIVLRATNLIRLIAHFHPPEIHLLPRALLRQLGAENKALVAAALPCLGFLKGYTQLYQAEVLPALMSLVSGDDDYHIHQFSLSAICHIITVDSNIDSALLLNFFCEKFLRLSWPVEISILSTLTLMAQRHSLLLEPITTFLLNSLAAMCEDRQADNDLVYEMINPVGNLIIAANIPLANIMATAQKIIFTQGAPVDDQIAYRLLAQGVKTSTVVEVGMYQLVEIILYLDCNEMVLWEKLNFLAELMYHPAADRKYLLQLCLAAVCDDHTPHTMIAGLADLLSRFVLFTTTAGKFVADAATPLANTQTRKRKRTGSRTSTKFRAANGSHKTAASSMAASSFSSSHHSIDDQDNYLFDLDTAEDILTHLLHLMKYRDPEPVQGVVAAFANFAKRPGMDKSRIMTALVTRWRDTDNFALKCSIIYSLHSLACLPGGIVLSVANYLAAKLQSKTNQDVADLLSRKIMHLGDSRMTNEIKDRFIYGSLLHKYYASLPEDIAVGAQFYKLIALMQQPRALDWQLQRCIPVNSVANLIKAYLV